MKTIVPVTILVLLLAACAPMTPTTPPMATDDPAADTPTASSEMDTLAGTQWTLVSFGVPDAEVPVVEGSTVTLEFGEGGQVGGEGGCNSYGGTYEVQEGVLVFGPMTSTLMACADESAMQQEEQYLAALQTAGEFTLTDDQLTIWYDDGQGVLTFNRAAGATSTPESETPVETPTPEDESARVLSILAV